MAAQNSLNPEHTVIDEWAGCISSQMNLHKVEKCRLPEPALEVWWP